MGRGTSFPNGTAGGVLLPSALTISDVSLPLYLLVASVNENHEIYMKDSVSAAEVGTGQYATTKGISQTNLITTVTPEKKAEEERDEDEDRRKRVEDVTPVAAARHEGKVHLPGSLLALA